MKELIIHKDEGKEFRSYYEKKMNEDGWDAVGMNKGMKKGIVDIEMSYYGHKFDNIFLVLAGELNTDHLDVVRWRYLDENDHPRYMTRKDIIKFIDAWITELSMTRRMTSDMLSEVDK